MYWFSRATERKYCILGGLRNRNLLSPSSGGWESEIASRFGSFHGFFPWFANGRLLPVSSHYLSSVSVSRYPLLRRKLIVLD